jgi:hypothetical protein
MSDPTPTHSAFVGHQLLASGSLQAVALSAFRSLAREPNASVLLFSNETGRQVDVDLHGAEHEVAARHAPQPDAPAGIAGDSAPARLRGRPRLGVVPREVTLLPEHWDWLATQPGGASVALRKLVLLAMRSSASLDATRRARERSYAFMAAIAGDLPGFEEASRALFAGDLDRLGALTAHWPPDIRNHVARLAQPTTPPAGQP